MTRLSIASLLALGAFAVAAPVFAQEAPPPAPVPASKASAPPSAAKHRGAKPGDRNCLRSTGSLLPAKPDQCLSVPGRSYSAEDIRRTGATNVSDALRKLDASIQ
ncbi:hypothetical protein [Frateuria defendens]|uniref:hypothetical protein n=1 Tax=Frateuria defendens TaxID=2219559 RepID=UPI0007DC3190|nr:hypothetical protein [Frateuria defendens]